MDDIKKNAHGGKDGIYVHPDLYPHFPLSRSMLGNDRCSSNISHRLCRDDINVQVKIKLCKLNLIRRQCRTDGNTADLTS